MKKYIIGLGCSWTQGEGGYPEHIWEQHNWRMQLPFEEDQKLRVYEHENSWVNVLCRDHFTEYTPVNLGVRGVGSRGAFSQLHFCDTVDWDNSEGIIVFMIPGLTRQDLLKPECISKKKVPDGYSHSDYVHYKWQQIYPSSLRNNTDSLYDTVQETLNDHTFLATTLMLVLLDLQDFCRLHGFKLVLVNPYNVHLDGTDKYLRDNTTLANKFDWSVYMHRHTEYVSMMQKLVSLEHNIKHDEWHNYFEYYNRLDRPAKYLTNCAGSHPTIEGYKVVAQELANFIKTIGYV